MFDHLFSKGGLSLDRLRGFMQMADAKSIAKAAPGDTNRQSQISRQIRDLTDLMEGGYPKPWAVDDAPAPFIDGQVRGIVGIEIAITAIIGKWKVSQNRSEADRAGVVAGLEERQDDEARAMAGLVNEKLQNAMKAKA